MSLGDVRIFRSDLRGAGASPVDLLGSLKRDDYSVVLSFRRRREFYRIPRKPRQDPLRPTFGAGTQVLTGHQSHALLVHEGPSDVLEIYGLGNFHLPVASNGRMRPTSVEPGLFLEMDKEGW